MGRKRSTGKTRSGHKPDTLDFEDPREEYIFGVQKVGLRALAKKHKIPFSTIRARSKRERWVERREEYQGRVLKETERKFMEKDSDRRTKILEMASERHMQAGRELQDTSMEALQKVRAVISKTDDGGMKPAEGLRAISQAMGKGVEIERKALGIADRIELDYRTTEMTREVIQVLEMFITDADLMENIVFKLSQIGKKDREELARLTAGDVVDAK